MATSLIMSSSSVNLPSILSPISSTVTYPNRQKMVTGFGLSKTNKLFSSQSSKRVLRFRNFKPLIAAKSSSFNDIPKEFREENLKDGLMENYKNVPEQLYGLSPSQINLFATKDSPIFRQAAKVKEESLSSARSYSDSWGMSSMSGTKDGGQSTYCSMDVSMYGERYSEGYNRGSRRKQNPGPPPDLPSELLHGRIVYLGLPMVDAVTELIMAELVYLHLVDPEAPIYLYINSTGIKNDQDQIVGDPQNAYGIVDMLAKFRGKIYTVNLGTAYGQAAMLLSRGTRGCRFLAEYSFVKLYLPSLDRVDGPTTDIYHEAKELQNATDIYLELLSRGIGKSEDVLREALRKSLFFDSQQTIDYGIADKMLPPDALGPRPSKEQMNKKKGKASPKYGEGEANPSGS